MLHSHLVNYSWVPGYVASEDMLAIAQWFKDNGLLSLGYKYANWDDCVVVGRDPVTKKLIPDPQAFPQGPRVVADALSALGFSMGFYTTRGNFTCASIKTAWPSYVSKAQLILRFPGSYCFFCSCWFWRSRFSGFSRASQIFCRCAVYI
jgi:hypothetical protein